MTPSRSVALASARQIGQIAFAGAGGLVFALIGAPAAWVSGPVAAVALLCLMRRSVPVAMPIVDLAMLLGGLSMGAAATPEALSAMGSYPASLALLGLSIVAVIGFTALWLIRMSGWAWTDAVLGATPGALSTVIAVAADRGRNVGVIAVVQSFRLAVLVILLPVAIVLIGEDVGAAPAREVMPPLPFALVIGASAVLGLVLRRINMAAPMLLGATVVSLVSHASGVVHGGLPTPIYTLALVLIGTFVGSRFSTVDRRSLMATLPAAIGSLVVSFAVALVFAAASAQVAEVSLAAAVIAFAPGGLEVMAVLALLLGLDPIFVGTHHLARFLLIGLLLPLIIGRIEKLSRRQE
jgi:membrane AbrB-like protein